MWDTLNLLPNEVIPKSYQQKIEATPQCDSFMHLHLGFDKKVCKMLLVGVCVLIPDIFFNFR